MHAWLERNIQIQSHSIAFGSYQLRISAQSLLSIGKYFAVVWRAPRLRPYSAHICMASRWRPGWARSLLDSIANRWEPAAQTINMQTLVHNRTHEIVDNHRHISDKQCTTNKLCCRYATADWLFHFQPKPKTIGTPVSVRMWTREIPANAKIY